MIKIVNLTPHSIVLRTEEGDVTVPPSGTVARVAVKQVEIECPGLPVHVARNEYGEVEGLPEPKDGTIYVVSSLVLSRVHGRIDVFAPDTGPTAIRDEAGRIVAVRRLVAAD